MKFEVWAPKAEKVVLQVAGQDHALHRGNYGWWDCDLPAVGGGVDYAYQLDGEGPLPDPRAPWQPYGVDGPSRTVDHGAFAWTDTLWQAKPLSAALIYELHIGTFTPEGTFDAAIGKLDHLVELGVTHVEVMPVAEFRGQRGWGYDGVDLYAPHHAYGGPDGLKRFVNACHERGLAAILDVVYNHLGPSGNYLSKFGPYFTDRHHTPWGSSLNFEGPHSDEVRRFFVDNALMWLRDYHFDGLRLDAVHAIVDTSAVHIIEQIATEVDELKAHLGRHLVLIAESDLNDPRVVRPWELGGFGVDAQWSDDIHHALHTVLTGEHDGYYSDFGRIADLAAAMKRPYVYAGRHSQFRQRTHGRPAIGLQGSKFVAYLQNHDQLGNRALGDRIGHLSSAGLQKIGAALIHLSPFIPMLFQGEEWGATAPFQYFIDFHDDPELAKAVSNGRRKEFAAFGWKPEDVPDPQSIDTFRRSKLDWDELQRTAHREMLEWHKALVRLRRQVNGLTDGRLDAIGTDFDEQARWLCVHRGPITIACNFANQPREVPLAANAVRDLLLASSNGVGVDGNHAILPGESMAVFGPRF
ncbi:MAG TPA: malto-oligosyltrehalose trehalohydrolase [Pirellulales bacterium]|nr:malto-oligosyltrehalose trehalohydrolase [Pirellulales bacterium]